MSTFTLAAGTLRCDGQPVLSAVPETVTLSADPRGGGVFLRTAAAQPGDRHELVLGHPEGVVRFTSCHRSDPFWMVPKAGTHAAEVSVETQFLLAETTGGGYLLLLPLLDGPCRCSLEGAADDTLVLVAETGARETVCQEVTALFIATGPDPYALMAASARSAMAAMKCGRLRHDKPLPAFADWFGWCTWDAFYGEVSAEKVVAGLASFAAGGIAPRFMILDDGWLSSRQTPTKSARLTAFAANDKFPGDLAPLIARVKAEFGLRWFLAWHAFGGYWGGVDPAALPAYGAEDQPREFSPGQRRLHENIGEWFGGVPALVPPEQISAFFNDFHRHLREQGVDGVKVDNQASIEALAGGHGGRVALMRAYHQALEGSAHTQLLGNLINCMSCSNDMIFSALNSNLTRSSTDFWPKQPESHGLHVYTNAQTSFWMGEFVHPDWDMFQSNHACGALHAAARAVGGCPIYVSDTPDGHDFAVLRKLVLSDGGILRALDPGRPTRDCLCRDPRQEPVLLKIFNHNRCGGVVGAFNVQYHEREEQRVIVSGHVSPADIEGLAGEQFAVYAHQARTVTQCARTERLGVWLKELTFEIYTVVPIMDGFAPLGLADKFNGGGAVLGLYRVAPAIWDLCLRDGGEFVAWCRDEPRHVTIGGRCVDWSFVPAAKLLTVKLPATGIVTVRLAWA